MAGDRRARALQLQEQLEPSFLAALRAAMAAASASEREVAEAMISLALARLAMLDAQIDTERQIREEWDTVALDDEPVPQTKKDPATR